MDSASTAGLNVDGADDDWIADDVDEDEDEGDWSDDDSDDDEDEDEEVEDGVEGSLLFWGKLVMVMLVGRGISRSCRERRGLLSI